MNPKVSVVVPIYNVENYLSKCLDSILEQTLDDIEIICVNDGSTDTSANILQIYEKKDARITVITQENKGLGAARNAGIMRASGEFIGFVDSDDFIDPTMFEKLYAKASKYDSDVVLTNVNLYFTDTGASQCFRNPNFYNLMSEEKYFTAMEHPKILHFIGVWDRIYRRSFLEKYQIFNPENRIYEDVLFTVKTSVLASRISLVNETLYYYRKNTGKSIVDQEQKNDSFKFDFLKNLKESKTFLQECNKWEDLRKEFLAFQFHMALYYQQNMQSRHSYIAFMAGLSEILSPDDVLELENIVNEKVSEKYLKRLKKRQFHLAYICYKLKKLYYHDEYHFFYRFPRMKKYWKIRKLNYRWKCEMKAKYDLIYEIQQLRKAVEEHPNQEDVEGLLK